MTRKQALIRDQILDLLDTLPHGAALPSERQLSAELSVARMTVRKAVEDLVQTGRLDRRQGSGTYVRETRTPREMRVVSFTEAIRRRGQHPTSRVIDITKTQAPPALAHRLEVPAGAVIYVLQRVRYADEVPVALETLHTTFEVGREAGWDGVGSFYEMLRTRHGVHVHTAVQDIEATVVDPIESEHLCISAGTPALLSTLVTRSSAGQVVEFVRNVTVGDTLRVRLSMQDELVGERV